MSVYTLEKLVPHFVLIEGPHGHDYYPVTQTIAHPPNTHPHSPIKNDHTAVEAVTNCGSRWFGTDRAWIGSDLRMHIMVNPRDEVRRKWQDPA